MTAETMLDAFSRGFAFAGCQLALDRCKPPHVLCGVCRNEDIEIEMWVRINSGVTNDDSGEGYYCGQCAYGDRPDHNPGHYGNHELEWLDVAGEEGPPCRQ